MHPILFHIGSFPVRAYGVLIIVGFSIGMWRSLRRCEWTLRVQPEGSPRRIHPDVLFDVGFWGLILSVIGARLLYVLLDWGEFAGHPIDALRIWTGGMSLHGAMLFAILTLIIVSRVRRQSLAAVSDIGAVGWSLSYAVGRLGCLFNGCCYGGVCDLPWGIRFPDEHHPGLLTPPSHPVPLYATLFNLFFFAILVQWEKRKRCDGEIFFAYIAMYGFYRYVMEAFRAGTTSTYAIPSLHLTDTHIISLVMMIVGVGTVVWLRCRRPAYRDGELPDAARIAPATPPTSLGGTLEHGA